VTREWWERQRQRLCRAEALSWDCLGGGFATLPNANASGELRLSAVFTALVSRKTGIDMATGLPRRNRELSSDAPLRGC
jgi:hypothetical protein